MAIRHLVKPLAIEFIGKKLIGPDVYTFSFRPPSNTTWRAGQYGLFEISLSDKKVKRKPFSIASVPTENNITIATRIKKDSQDVFKQALLKIKKGTSLKLRGPIGSMYIKNYHKKYAFLASGISITPFRSILKQLSLSDKTKDINIKLFYVGNRENHFFRDDLNEFKSKLPNLEVIYIYKPERITGQVIEEKLGQALFSTVFFLSGSPSLVKNYRRTLEGLGISKKYIKRNPFWGYKTSKNQSL